MVRGIVGCLVVATARRREAGAWATVVVRFSPLAGGALLVVGIAGGALGWTEVRSVDALFEHDLRAAADRQGRARGGGRDPRGDQPVPRFVPVLDEAAPGPIPASVTQVLRRTLAAEALVLMSVVGATAVLVDVTPARAAVAAPFVDEAPLGEGGPS